MSAIIILILRVFVIISLYLFLMFSIYILWKDLFSNIKRTDKSISIKKVGNDHVWTFSSSEIFIGRDAIAHIQLSGNTISNMHARLFYKQKQWRIEDLQSTNGTYLNGVLLTEPVPVFPGDQISCGNIELEMIEINKDLFTKI